MTAPRGFTLAELLVALTIVVVGLGALLAAINQGLGNSQLVRERVEARYQAEQALLLEIALPGRHTQLPETQRGGAFRTQLTEHPDPETHVVELTAVTSWASRGHPRRVTMTTAQPLRTP